MTSSLSPDRFTSTRKLRRLFGARCRDSLCSLRRALAFSSAPQLSGAFVNAYGVNGTLSMENWQLFWGIFAVATLVFTLIFFFMFNDDTADETVDAEAQVA